MNRQYFKQNVSPTHTFDGTVEHTLNIIAKTVGATYGPYGTFNLFKSKQETTASKDGYENVTMMRFDGSIADAVHRMVIDMAGQQAQTVGDGTTTAILFVAELYKQLKKNEDIQKLYTPTQVSEAMASIQGAIIQSLEETAIKISSPDDVWHLVNTSTDENAELAKLLMTLYQEVEGLADKNILIETSRTEKSYIKTVQGVNLKGQLMNPAFGNHDMETCKLHNVEVIIVDGKANIETDILNYVNKLKTQDKSLLILCSGVNENFYRYVELISRQQPEVLRNFCVAYCSANTIQDKDLFYDLLKITNCAYLPENTAISSTSIVELSKGVAANISVKGRKITLGGFTATEEFDAYLSNLRSTLEELIDQEASGTLTNEDSGTNRVAQGRLRARIEMLTTGVVTAYIGGDTAQRKWINFRLFEDGLKALQSTIRHGFTAGCNAAVMNTVVRLISLQRKADAQGSRVSLYGLLLQCILNAYIEVYGKLISNRVRYEKVDLMKTMLTDVGLKYFDEETCELRIPQAPSDVMRNLVFSTIDLRGGGEQAIKREIINPVQTDINIIQQGVDLALILATSHTIFVDDVEFEAQV